MATSKTKQIRKTADYLVDRLKREGFKVQRYDAYSTNSVYLKLDYGVCNSIRISDHKGKQHLQYRYNVEIGRTQFETTFDNFLPRYFVPTRMKAELVDMILQDRAQKIEKYGKNRYLRFMEDNKKQGMEKPGFWQSAVEV